MTINDWGTSTVLVESEGGTSESTFTKGDTLYASASNTLSKLAVGSDNQVMKLAGGIPSWAAATGGSGDWVPLAQATASSSASLSFDDTIITTTYNLYAFIIFGWSPASTSALYIRLSPDNGSTVRATGYQSTAWTMNSTSRNDYTTQIQPDSVSLATDSLLVSTFYLANASDSGVKTVACGLSGYATGTPNYHSGWFQGIYDTAETHDFIEFSQSAGNIATGTVYCYGVNAS